MNLIFIGGIIVALMLLLWLSRRRSSEPSTPPDPSEYLVRLPPSGLFSRCLSVEDMAFVAELHSPAVSRLLLHERRRLAMLWLRLARQEAGRLYDLHVRTARYAADLRPVAEARLAVQYGLFLLVYRMMVTLVWFYGPVRTRALVGSVQTLAAVLSGLGGTIAESIGPAPARAAAGAHGD